MPPLRTVRYVAWIGVVLVGIFLAWSYFAPTTRIVPDARYQLSGPISEIGGPFTLVDHSGQVVTQENFVGKPTMVFFGFTSCPDVCPTALWNVSELLRQLGDSAKDVRVLFISVDPERDTPERFKANISSFDSRIIGLTGAPDQVATAAKAYRAYFKKVLQDGGSYTIDHTATVYLMDRAGKFRGTVDVREAKEASLAKLQRLVAKPAGNK